MVYIKEVESCCHVVEDHRHDSLRMKQKSKDELGCIYMLQVPNGKKYIGQTKNLRKRFNNYRSDLKCGRKKTKLYSSLRKYGWEAFRKKIIWKCTIEELDYYEEKFISDFKTIENGLNLARGGRSGTRGTKRTEEQKHEKSLQMLKRVKRTGNIEKRVTNTKGVRYYAKIKVQGKYQFIGTYSNIDDAKAAIVRFKREHGV